MNQFNTKEVIVGMDTHFISPIMLPKNIKSRMTPMIHMRQFITIMFRHASFNFQLLTFN